MKSNQLSSSRMWRGKVRKLVNGIGRVVTIGGEFGLPSGEKSANTS